MPPGHSKLEQQHAGVSHASTDSGDAIRKPITYSCTVLPDIQRVWAMGGAKEQTKCHIGGGDDETRGGSGTHIWECHMLASSRRVLIWGDMGFG